MELNEVLERLRAKEGWLRSRGVGGLSVFGSVARGEAGPESDVDLAIRQVRPLGLSGTGILRRDLAELLGTEVDLVVEPVVMKPRLQRMIDRDRAVAF